MSETNTPQTSLQDRPLCAGIDIGKARLDVALSDGVSLKHFANDAEGHALLADALKARGISRIGMEATGNYGADVACLLRRQGFEVQLFQPPQVKAFARFKLERAKSDRIDARLIALATADLKAVRPAMDERLQDFAQDLTLIEQLGEDLRRNKTRLEQARSQHAVEYLKAESKRLKSLLREEYKRLEAMVREHADLACRLDLILSIDGVGQITALTLLIRMPELGGLERGQPASLLGVAPFLRESGLQRGERHIAGGRARPRTAVFACAQVAIKWNAHFKSLYDRLKARGRAHTSAIIACSRKLIELVNVVLKRGTPWTEKAPQT